MVNGRPPISVNIDKVVLRNVDDTDIGSLAGLVAEQLLGETGDGLGPIPGRGRAMVEGAADRIARSVRDAMEAMEGR